MASLTQLFVNIQATSLANALVRSVQDLQPVGFPQLVIGDGRQYELYFVDGLGGFVPWSGNGAYIPYLAIGNCGYPTGGTFKLTFSQGGDQTTGNLAYNISTAALQTALEALSNIGSGNVLVTGSAGKYYQVEFIGTLAGMNVPALLPNFSGLTPAGTVETSVITEGSVGVNEVQVLTLAINPITFADDWTTITNGWTGTLSIRTVGIIQALAAAGASSFTDTFQITVGDPLGVRQTYVKTPATIVCTIINPESFAGTDQPLLATQAALNAAILGNNNFGWEAQNSTTAGNTNVTPLATSRHWTADMEISGTASARTISLVTANSPQTGDIILLRIAPTGAAGSVVTVHNSTSGGTLLETLTTNASGQFYSLIFVWDGSIWGSEFNSFEYLSKAENLSGVASPIAARANLLNIFSRNSSQSASFSVLVTDDGTYFSIVSTAGAVTVTFPSAVTAGAGFLFCLQKIDASVNVVSTPFGNLSNAGQSVIVYSDGTTWIPVLGYNPAQSTVTAADVILNWDFLTGITGGTSLDLNGQPTAAGAVTAGTLVAVTYTIGSALKTTLWQLVAGTDVDNGSTIIRPIDFNATTNAVVWKLTNSSPNSYEAISNSTGNFTVTPVFPNHLAVVNVTGSAGTRVVILDLTGQIAGDMARFRFNLPATAAIVIEIRNATSGGTLLFTLTTDGSGDDWVAECYFDGTAWQKYNNTYPAF